METTNEIIKCSWSAIECITKERDAAYEWADRFNLDSE